MMKQDPHFSEDEQFENFLSAQLKQSQPYLMDDNFSAQVMAKLPAKKKLSVRQERLIIVLPLVVISVLVLSQFSLFALGVKLYTLLVAVDVASLMKMGLAISAVAFSSASYWFARQARLFQ
ncbi:hypothetical protein [Cellvibrio sp.]|uniref:hypothetical protein n=1 Tax=Cellvibrio sp. TaxID=1965322 RepID=UPI0039647E4C